MAVSDFRIRYCGILLTVSAFILPLKLGTLAAMPEAGSFFPSSVIDYFFITWPAHFSGILSALLLLLTIVAVGVPELPKKKLVFTLLWSAAPLLAALPGFYYGWQYDRDLCIGEFSNLAALAAWSVAVSLFTQRAPQWGQRMVVAFFLGIIVTAVNGFYQYFFGFAEMDAFIAEQQSKGIRISDSMKLKLTDRRIYSFMASSNALAGLLLPGLLLGIFFGVKWGKYFEPARVSKIVFSAAAAALLTGALLLTGSRSALLCLICAAAAAAFSYPKIKLSYKIAAAFCALLLAAGGLLFAVHLGRGTATMKERLDYLRTSAVISCEKPLTGAGWGGFFYRHMRIKMSSTDEAARDPHNIAASFASQCGLPAALLITAMLLCPLVILWKKRFCGMDGAVFWCGVMFTLHILQDCDMHIPAILFGMSMLYLTVLPTEDPLPAKRTVKALAAVGILALVLVSFGGNFIFVRGEKAFSDYCDMLNPPSAETAGATPQDVLAAFEKLRTYRPGLALIWELHGDWALANGDITNAEINYRTSEKLNPQRPSIYRKQAFLAYAAGNDEKAKQLFGKAGKLFPRNRRYDPDHEKNREREAELKQRFAR